MLNRPPRFVTQLVVLGYWFGAVVHGQQSATTLPAETEHEVAAWIEAFNSGDFTAMEAVFGADAHSDPESRQRLLRQYETFLITRGIDPLSVEPTGKDRVTIRALERLSGDRVNVILDLSRGTPRLDAFRLERGEQADSSVPALSEADVLAELDRQITRRGEVGEFSGAVLVAKEGETLFKKAWGVANKSTGAPNRVDTRFNLASCGKMFTAVAVLQLVQAGKLDLDDKVGKHLPEHGNEDVRKKVTIRQLLSHTSGMGDIFTDEFEERRESIRTVADWVSLFESTPLRFEPGTRWSYSNAGFCLLGAIVEAVSGEDYYLYLDRHILGPAGMTNTGAFETDKPVENLAIGYTRMGAATPEEVRDRRENTGLHSVKGSPAGGSYSTVEDLAAFAHALLNDTLLDEEHVQLAMTRHFPDVRNADPYGLGFGVEDVDGHRIVGHGGGFPGISAAFDMFIDDGYVVVVLCNQDMVARRFSMYMRDWITKQPARQ